MIPAPVRLYRKLPAHLPTGRVTVAATVRYKPTLPHLHRLISLNECMLLTRRVSAPARNTVAQFAVDFTYTHCGRFGPLVDERYRLPVELGVLLPRGGLPGRLEVEPGTRLRGAELSPDGQELLASILILATWRGE